MSRRYLHNDSRKQFHDQPPVFWANNFLSFVFSKNLPLPRSGLPGPVCPVSSYPLPPLPSLPLPGKSHSHSRSSSSVEGPTFPPITPVAPRAPHGPLAAAPRPAAVRTDPAHAPRR